jgi:hypothetical protein
MTKKTDRNDRKGSHASPRVEGVLLNEARINDEHHAIDGDRRLGDVSGKDHLSCTFGCRLENLRLQIRGQIGIDRTDNQFWYLVSKCSGGLGEVLLSGLDLFLTLYAPCQQGDKIVDLRRAYSKEDEDVTFWLCGVYLEHRRDRRMQIICLGLWSVVNVDWETTSWNYMNS